MTVPRPPRGAGPAGKRLWRAVQSEYQLDEHEQALLVALVRQVDRLDQLAGCVPDQQVVDLFLFFAREDRQWWEAQM